MVSLYGMTRQILHLDMDEFFAAVEKLDNPKLCGKPLLVGGDAASRGVVSTASYEAREFGCHSAMPMATAIRLCPQAIVLPVRGRRYHKVSEQLFAIFGRFTPLIEPLSIDEAFLDLTGTERLFGPATETAARIKQCIGEELKLTCSVGLAPNKFLAKLASDLEKPNGLVIITPQNVQQVLDPLPIRKLWGVGPAAEKQFHRLNIRTIGQLRRMSSKVLREALGEVGEHFLRLANGQDNRPVTPDSRAKSIGQEQTFAVDVAELDELRRVLLQQTEQVARRLRRHGRKARTVTIKLRYGDFTTLSRSRTPEEAMDLTEEIWQAASCLFDRWAARHHRPLRLLGMAVSQLQDTAGQQLKLFESPQHRKRRKLDRALDAIAERFGEMAIRRGTVRGKNTPKTD